MHLLQGDNLLAQQFLVGTKERGDAALSSQLLGHVCNLLCERLSARALPHNLQCVAPNLRLQQLQPSQ